MNTIKHRNGTVQVPHKGKVTWAVRVALSGTHTLSAALDQVKASPLDREAAEAVLRRTLALTARKAVAA